MAKKIYVGDNRRVLRADNRVVSSALSSSYWTYSGISLGSYASNATIVGTRAVTLKSTTAYIAYYASGWMTTVNSSSTLIANHKYYISFKYRCNTDIGTRNITIRGGAPTSYSSRANNMAPQKTVRYNNGEWEEYAGVFSAVSDYHGSLVVEFTSDSSDQCVIVISDQFMLIDLTSTFGEGNEPTDLSNISYFSGTGKISIETPSPVANSIGKAYIGVNANYPIYQDAEITLTKENYLEYFDLVSGGDSGITNNDTGLLQLSAYAAGYGTITTTTALRAKQFIKRITFDWSAYCQGSNGYCGYSVGKWSRSVSSSEDFTDDSGFNLFAGDTLTVTSHSYANSYNEQFSCGIRNIKITVNKLVSNDVKLAARRIKKAYIGKNNKARLFWSKETLNYYTPLYDDLSVGGPTRCVSLQDKVFAISGPIYSDWSGSYATDVNIYNSNLTSKMGWGMSCDRNYYSLTQTDSKFAVVGGHDANYSGDGYNLYDFVEVYDYDSVGYRSVNIGWQAAERDGIAAATAGNTMIFVGGWDPNGLGSYSSLGNYVTAVNEDLTFTQTTLPFSTACMSGASVGDKAIFAGGLQTLDSSLSSSYEDYYYSDSNRTLCYTDTLTLTQSTLPDTSESSRLAGSNASGMAVFGMHKKTSYPEDYPNNGRSIYKFSGVTSNLTYVSGRELPYEIRQVNLEKIGEDIMLPGGVDNTGHVLSTLNIVTSNLTVELEAEHKYAATRIGSGKAGEYILVAGGDSEHNEVHVYTLNQQQ